MSDKINPNFFEEIVRSCLRSKSLLEICKEYIKYHYLKEEREKKIWKAICNHLDANNSLPTIGTLAQMFNTDKDVTDLIVKIKNAQIVSNEVLLLQLEEFVKRSMFVEGYDKLGDLYNEGDKEKAFKTFFEFGQKLVNFSIKEKYFEPLFKGFKQRYETRVANKALNKNSDLKVPFSIDLLDKLTQGGMGLTDIALFLAQSGVGKSKILKYIGVCAALLGFDVLHIQAEGSKQECEDLYDATMAEARASDIEFAGLSDKRLQELLKEIEQVNGEVHIQAFEQFGSASLLDVRQAILDFEKVHGKVPDLILLDYFELFEPGDGKKYSTNQEGEKARRQAIGRGLKNIAVELKTRIATATQASDVQPIKLNSPEFVLTRADIRGDKNTLDPFSFLISMNQTLDEYAEGIMRLYCDKFRKYKAKQTIYICQNYDREQFYDRERTLEEYPDIILAPPKKKKS